MRAPMMLWWRGWGIFTPVVTVLALLASERLFPDSNLGAGLVWLAAGATNFAVWYSVRGEDTKQDPKKWSPNHSLFWLPMSWFSVPMVLGGMSLLATYFSAAG